MCMSAYGVSFKVSFLCFFFFLWGISQMTLKMEEQPSPNKKFNVMDAVGWGVIGGLWLGQQGRWQWNVGSTGCLLEIDHRICGLKSMKQQMFPLGLRGKTWQGSVEMAVYELAACAYLLRWIVENWHECLCLLTSGSMNSTTAHCANGRSLSSYSELDPITFKRISRKVAQMNSSHSWALVLESWL